MPCSRVECALHGPIGPSAPLVLLVSAAKHERVVYTGTQDGVRLWSEVPLHAHVHAPSPAGVPGKRNAPKHFVHPRHHKAAHQHQPSRGTPKRRPWRRGAKPLARRWPPPPPDVLLLTVPETWRRGDVLAIETPTGQLRVHVPIGAGVGDTLEFKLPSNCEWPPELATPPREEGSDKAPPDQENNGNARGV